MKNYFLPIFVKLTSGFLSLCLICSFYACNFDGYDNSSSEQNRKTEPNTNPSQEEEESQEETSEEQSASAEENNSSPGSPEENNNISQATIVSYDFTSSFPSGTTSNNCEISNGALVIKKKSDGTYGDECYVDIEVGAETVSKKMVSLNAAGINLIFQGNFSDVTENDIGLYSPTSNTSLQKEKTTGLWFSDANSSTNQPVFLEDSYGNLNAVIQKRGSLVQYVKIKPGEDFRLTYTMDPTNLGESDGIEQAFYLKLYFLDNNFKTLTFLDPISNSTVSFLGNLRSKTRSDDKITESFLIRTIDCNTHTKYTPNQGTYAADVSFNHCRDSNNIPLTNDEGISYTEGNIAYAGIEFSVNWKGDGFAYLDDVRLEYEKQTEIKVMNKDGIAEYAALGTDLYVGKMEDKATLRIYLRSLDSTQSPYLKTVSISDGPVIQATLGEKQVTITKPRLGFTGFIPPAGEWYDSHTIRSQCLDHFNNNTPMGCLEFLVKYGVARWRTNIPLNYLYTTLAGSSYSFLFHDGSYDDKQEPYTYLNHLTQMAQAGMDILMIIDNEGEDSYYFDKGYLAYWDSITGYLNDAYDPTPTDNTNDGSESLDLILQATKFLVTLFDGTHNTYFSGVGADIRLPQINNWQVGVETNLTQPTWFENLTDEEEAKVLSEIANAVFKINPQAHIGTSLNPHNNTTHQTFDYAYLEDILSKVESSQYTHFNFNTFNDGDDILPEEWISSWPLLQKEPYFNGWKDKELTIGAYDYLHDQYDPACDTSKWERGFGIKRFSKLNARAVLSALAMPVEDIYDYSIFNTEGWSGGNLTYDSCWRSGDSMSQLFDRVAGTGSLNGIDAPSSYQLNQAGVVYMTIARYLSTSSPYTLTINQNNFYGSLFETVEGKKIVALWQVLPDGDYITDYMNYVSGYTDEGFTKTSQINLELIGLSGITKATLIRLDESNEEELSVDTLPAHPVLKNIVLNGDMPILIQLE